MDSATLAIIQTLCNLGGLGILSAVLFYLHTKSLATFREELKAERDQRDAHHKDNAREFKDLRHGLGNLRQQVESHHAVINYVAGLKPAPAAPVAPAPTGQ